MEELTVTLTRYGQAALDYFSQPVVLYQLGIIAIVFLPALALSWWVEPKLEERARRIKRMPGLLRFVIALLRRLEWVFFVILLMIAYSATNALGWPGQNQLIYAALVLSGAWLAISVVSHAIKSRILRRTFAIAAWAYVAATVLGVTGQIATLLSEPQWTPASGNFTLSPLTFLQSVLILGLLFWGALVAGNFFERRIGEIDELTPSLRVLFGKIVRIGLIVGAVLAGINTLGINLTALTVLSGAVGVGIGFGLQKVVSNFISGIIILMDQSIKPGDTISLGDTFGWIRELRARFVSVVTRDGREYLIPNEDLITQQVINWSFSDKFVRLDVPFGVSYDSDPHEVTNLAIEAASSVDRVDGSFRKPVCWMTEFGDSSLNFLLRFWIRDPQQGLTNVRGKVLLALWDSFKANGVGIPFPHREVIMKTPITVESASRFPEGE